MELTTRRQFEAPPSCRPGHKMLEKILQGPLLRFQCKPSAQDQRSTILAKLGGGVCIVAISLMPCSSVEPRRSRRRRLARHRASARRSGRSKLQANADATSTLPNPTELFLSAEASKDISDADIRIAFQKFDKNQNGAVSVEEFLEMCLEDLHVDLTEIEVRRLFANLDHNNSGEITFASFRHGIRRSALFRSVVFDDSGQATHHVSDDYDYTVPTYIAHRHPDYVVENATGTSCTKEYDGNFHGQVYGEFVDIRKTLDYCWHTNYTKERQRWQDKVVRRVAQCAWPQNRPWVVFTCGAMGSGKGHVMGWLSKHNIFPLEHIVHIDPDHFKNLMPEWKGYTQFHSEEAGGMCHKESGFLQELATEVAMLGSQNVWIDGSLADHEWYTKVFQDIRTRFPKYRIALIYVYCSPEQVFERAARRGKITGRRISPDLLTHSISRTSTAVQHLSPLTDFSARIDNQRETPWLEVCNDRSHSFVSLRNCFQLDKEKKRFPSALDYISVCRDALLSKHMELPAGIGGALCGGVKELQRVPILQCFKPEFHETLKQAIVDTCGSESEPVYVMLTPAAKVNMDHRSRQLADIPANATHFSMLHGCCTADWAIVEVLPRFQQGTGSFVYMDDHGRVIGVNTMRRRAVHRQHFFFQCSAPIPLPPAMDWGLELADRWVRHVTPPETVNIAAAVAWLLPGELPDAPFGGFAYRFNDGEQEMFFPMAPGE